LVQTPVLSPWLAPEIELTSWSVLLLMSLAIAAIGVVLSGVYLALLSGSLREDSLQDSLAGVGHKTFSLGLALLLLAIFTLITAGITTFIPQQSPLVVLAVFLQAVLFWVFLVFFFVDAAIFVGGLGILAAIGRSLAFVWRYFWPSLGIFAIVQIISYGIPLVWARLPGDLLTQSWTAPAAIAIHLYLLSGLAAGVMVFYRNRAPLLAQVQA
jgi:hypothetical protein